MRKSHAAIIEEITQRGGTPPPGYSFHPFRDPMLQKLTDEDDDAQVANEQPKGVKKADKDDDAAQEE